MYEQRIQQQMEPEHHGDTSYGDTVAQQQWRVAYRVRFAFCSDTHNLWLPCQGRSSGSADRQVVPLPGGRRLLHLTSSIPSAAFLHRIYDALNRSCLEDRYCFTMWIVPKNPAHFHSIT